MKELTEAECYAYLDGRRIDGVDDEGELDIFDRFCGWSLDPVKWPWPEMSRAHKQFLLDEAKATQRKGLRPVRI